MAKLANLGYYFAGNGLVVADKNSELFGDYAKVAHILGKPNQQIENGEHLKVRIFKNYIAKVNLSYSEIKNTIKKQIEKNYPDSDFEFEDDLANP